VRQQAPELEVAPDADDLVGPDDPGRERRRERRLAWAELFKRVWQDDARRCTSINLRPPPTHSMFSAARLAHALMRPLRLSMQLRISAWLGGGPSSGRLPLQWPAATARPRRPLVLGRPLTAVVTVVRGAHVHQTRDGDPLASRRLPPLLGLALPPAPAGPTQDRAFLEGPHPPDGDGEPHLGCATDPWLALPAGRRGRRAHGLALRAPPAPASWPDAAGPSSAVGRSSGDGQARPSASASPGAEVRYRSGLTGARRPSSRTSSAVR
jgi:hypothetical protein